MSVYSGFATRKLENFYNKLIAKLLHLLTQKFLAEVPYSEVARIISGSQIEGQIDEEELSIENHLVALGLNKDIHEEMREEEGTGVR